MYRELRASYQDMPQAYQLLLRRPASANVINRYYISCMLGADADTADRLLGTRMLRAL